MRAQIGNLVMSFYACGAGKVKVAGEGKRQGSTGGSLSASTRYVWFPHAQADFLLTGQWTGTFGL